MDLVEILRLIIEIGAILGISYGIWWFVTYRNDQTAVQLAKVKRWFAEYGDLLKETDEELYDSMKSLLSAVEAANGQTQPISGFVRIVTALWGLANEAEKRLSGAYGDTFELDEEEEDVKEEG